MKNILLAGFCMMLSMLSFGQEWTPEQLALLDKYGLEKTDHRGLVLIENTNTNCETVQSIEEAILFFFTTDKRKDVTFCCIQNSSQSAYLSDEILDIHQVTELYLSLLKQKNK